MSTRLGIPFTAVIVFAGCQEDVSTPAPADELNFVDLLPEDREALKRYLAERNLDEGEWVEKDGGLVCEGFLTKFESDDFCSAGAPEDWVPIAYQGQESVPRCDSGRDD